MPHARLQLIQGSAILLKNGNPAIGRPVDERQHPPVLSPLLHVQLGHGLRSPLQQGANHVDTAGVVTTHADRPPGFLPPFPAFDPFLRPPTFANTSKSILRWSKSTRATRTRTRSPRR